MGGRLERVVRSRRQVEDEALDESKRINRLQHPVEPRRIGVCGELEKDWRQVVDGSAFSEQVAQGMAAVEWTGPGRGVRAVEIERDVGGSPDKGRDGRGQFGDDGVRRDGPPGIGFDEIDPHRGGCRLLGDAGRHGRSPVVGHPIVDDDGLV